MQMILNKKLLTSIPFQLLVSIALALICSYFLPLPHQRGFYTFSLMLKEALVFLVPLMIISSVFKAFTKMPQATVSFLLLLLGAVVCSNFLSVQIGGIIGHLSYHMTANISLAPGKHTFTPLLSIELPKMMENNIALLTAFASAFFHRFKPTASLSKVMEILEAGVMFFFKKLFMPLLPLFTFGFILKLANDPHLSHILQHNLHSILAMLGGLGCHLTVLLTFAAKLEGKDLKAILKNTLSPAAVASTSLSSNAALPFSMTAAEKNTGDPLLAKSVMPATVNIHMVGDSICIPVMALMVLYLFQVPLPTLSQHLLFSLAFVLTKFSGAGVPGGSIFVMIPVLEKFLGFSPEMSAIITILYMLLDPLTTSGNVVGNNAFVILFKHLLQKATGPTLPKKV